MCESDKNYFIRYCLFHFMEKLEFTGVATKYFEFAEWNVMIQNQVLKLIAVYRPPLCPVRLFFDEFLTAWKVLRMW